MKMYVWNSEMLRCYRRGHIVILANTLEEAREKAFVDGEKYIRTTWDWYDGEDVNVKMKELREDISKTPDEVDSLFVQGSE